MLISYLHNFIFIHNPKVAGKSIESALLPYATQYMPHSPLLNFLLGKNRRVRKKARSILERWGVPFFQDHATSHEMRNILGDKKWHKMFVFGFVRNSWDRQVSLYHYMLRSPGHPQHELIKSFHSFDEYIEWRVYEDLNLQSIFFVDEQGNIMVDFVGRIESINEDFRKITDTLNLPPLIVPHKNTTSHGHYSTYYSPYSRDLVAKYFLEDIDRFGFTFEVK